MSHRLDTAAVLSRIKALHRTDSAGKLAAQLKPDSQPARQSNADQMPDPITFAEIAELGGVSIEWLLTGKPNSGLADTSTLSRKVVASEGKDVPPPVNMVLNHPLLDTVREHMDPSFLVTLVREEIHQGPRLETSGKEAATEVAEAVRRRASAFILVSRSHVNATGIIIHTGWGNASLHPEARARLLEAAGATATGAINTPPRTEICERLLCAITGAEAATVTTLNAANYILLSGALAAGREIVIAARDLVEISQGARIADILESAGARVVAVGSANCVYIDDYRRAITPQTAMLMRIHASNIATSGYIAHVDGTALSDLAQENELVYAENLGGGSLVDLTARGLPWCPTLQQGLASGADLVFASGDKIIGGPQAGIVVGRKLWVDRLAKHPLARVCRADKLTLAALEATLAVYLAGRAWDEIPVLRLLKEAPDALQERAAAIASNLRHYGYDAVEVPDTAECGGAVLPGVELPTWVVKLQHPKLEEDQLRAILLARGVIARRKQGAVLLDLRSVTPEDDHLLERALMPPQIASR